MSPERDVEILERETVFSGYYHIDRYQLRHRLYSGGWSSPMSREIFERGHAVAVLPYDPVADRVGLIEQFRPGAYAAGWPCWLVEIVAGIIEPGESVEQVARREAQEEAGAILGRLEEIGAFLVDSGGSSHTTRLFCGEVRADSLSGLHGLETEHEDIRVFTLPADEAISWAQNGRIVNAAAIIALQWLALNRDRLRAGWRNGQENKGNSA